jgi:hypothetical protein
VTRLVAAEFVKFRTTRAWIGFVLVILVLTAIGSAATIGDAKKGELGSAKLASDVVSTALVAALIVFLIGILAVTSEFRHGTVTRTFLVAPRRERVILAKEIWVGLLAVGLSCLALVVVLSVAVIWLGLESTSLHVDGDLAEHVLRVVLVSILWGALGVGVGAVVQSQTLAVVGSIIWILIVEGLIGALLGLVDLDGVTRYLPGGALSALDGTEGGLSPWAGGGVALAWVVGLGALGVARISRQDIT